MRWNLETRRNAADLFEKGYGYKAVAMQLGLKRSAVREWAYIYRALGREGFCSEGLRRTYPPEVKLAVAKAHCDEGLSVADTMVKFGVGNRRQVKDWARTYKQNGDTAFAADAK